MLYQLLIIFALLGLTWARETFPSAATEAVDASFTEENAVMYDSLNNVNNVISIYDFLRVPFYPDSNAEDKQLLQYFLSAPDFSQRREALIKSNYFMDAVAYDRLHGKALASLKRIAHSVGIPMQRHLCYNTMLTEIEDAISSSENASFAELGVELSALHQSAYLFENRHTTMSAMEEDAMVLGLGDKIKELVSKLKSWFSANMCMMCQRFIHHIQNNACNLFGTAVCNVLLGAISGGSLNIFSKFICGKPLNIGGILGSLCNRGITFIRNKVGVSNACLCSFSLSLKIPAVSIPLIGDTPAISIGQNKPICSTKPGECAWNSKKDKDAFKKSGAAVSDVGGPKSLAGKILDGAAGGIIGAGVRGISRGSVRLPAGKEVASLAAREVVKSTLGTVTGAIATSVSNAVGAWVGKKGKASADSYKKNALAAVNKAAATLSAAQRPAYIKTHTASIEANYKKIVKAADVTAGAAKFATNAAVKAGLGKATAKITAVTDRAIAKATGVPLPPKSTAPAKPAKPINNKVVAAYDRAGKLTRGVVDGAIDRHVGSKIKNIGLNGKKPAAAKSAAPAKNTVASASSAAAKRVSAARAAVKPAAKKVVKVVSNHADLLKKAKAGTVKIGEVFKLAGKCYKLQSKTGTKVSAPCSFFYY